MNDYRFECCQRFNFTNSSILFGQSTNTRLTNQANGTTVALEYVMLDILHNLNLNQNQKEVDFGTCAECGAIFMIDLYLENIQEIET